jgi:hypothetical protein
VTVLAFMQISSEETDLNGHRIDDETIEEEKKGSEND